MVAIISLVIILVISLLIVKVGSVALMMTGLSKDIARFQAQSAFSGVGFTTTESELITKHPARRKTIRVLMLLGNVGITSAVASLILSFNRIRSGKEGMERILLILAFVLFLFLIMRSKAFDRYLVRVIKKALHKWTELKLYDYEHLLAIDRGYSIANILVEKGDWVANKTIAELKLNEEGILVLGIKRREGIYIGAPDANRKIDIGDTLTCYGKEDILRELRTRKSGSVGDKHHKDTIQRYSQIRRQEKEIEKRL